MRAVFFSLVVLVWASTAHADPLSLEVANATVTDVIEVSPPGPSATLSIRFPLDAMAAFEAFTTANLGKTVELRQNGVALFSFVVAEVIGSGRVGVMGIDPERALGLARRIIHTTIVLEPVAP